VVACLLILAVTVVGTVSLVRAYDLSPMALVKMVPGLSRFFGAPSGVPANTKPVPAIAEKVAAPRPLGRTLTLRAWRMWKDAPDAPNFLDPTVDAPQSFQTTRTFQPGFEFIEGGLIQADQTKIRLGWIASLPATAICMSEQSTKFACGLMARASLSVLAAKEPLVCYPDVSLTTENPLYLCQSHGRDLSLAQIEAGFALPAFPSLSGLVKLEQTARDAHAGAWNGNWTIIPPGGGSTTPASTP
jgi:endonuclease YncB( thermonuclease family)